MLKGSLVVVVQGSFVDSDIVIKNYDLIPPELGYATSSGRTAAANTTPVSRRRRDAAKSILGNIDPGAGR